MLEFFSKYEKMGAKFVITTSTFKGMRVTGVLPKTQVKNLLSSDAISGH